MKNSILNIYILAVLFVTNLANAQTNTPNDYFQPSVNPNQPSYTQPAYNVNWSAQMFNYVRTYKPLTPLQDINSSTNLSKVSISTNYLNGWGQSIEQIKRVGNIGAKDIIQPIDRRYSLNSFSYLPYSVNHGSLFMADPFNDQLTYYSLSANGYNTEAGNTFSLTQTTASNNIIYTNSYSPGASFVGYARGTTQYSRFNTSADATWNWIINSNGLPEIAGVYNDFELTETITTGQHNAQVKEITNKSGQLICKKVFDGTSWLNTYYVYNDFGQIVWILPPKVFTTTSYTGWVPSQTIRDQLCYHYVYNSYGQTIETKNPDQDGIQATVYDKWHRAILVQTPLMATLNQWQYNIYDTRGRVVMSGLTNNSNSRSAWQSYIDGATPYYTAGSLEDYLVNGFTGTYPSSPSFTVDVYNYYDRYDKLPTDLAPQAPVYFNSDYLNFTEAEYPSVFEDMTQGLLVGSKTRVLDPNNSNVWIKSKYFYDRHGRLVQTHTLNPLQTNTSVWDISGLQYDFSGNTILSIMQHYGWPGTNKASTKVQTKYTYDYTRGQLTNVQQQVDNFGWRSIAHYEYDDLGKIKKETLGNVEERDLDYNIRGQLSGINKDYVYFNNNLTNRTFGEIVCYDYGFSDKRYDGKATGFIWRGNGTLAMPRAYGYKYDAAGRMTDADFNERLDPSMIVPPNTPTWKNTDVDYSVNGISYDWNGNMQGMTQKGMAFVSGTYQPVTIDDLDYYYNPNSNRLDHIDDNPASYHINDFHDLHTTGSDYDYDEDGNLKADANKGISAITYNHMDLPVSVLSGSGSAQNIYDASGALFQKTVTENSNTDVFSYWGPFTYKNGDLQYFLHAEGRTRWLSDSLYFKDEFFVKDHFGNVRTIVTADVSYGTKEYNASFETMYANVEESIFDNIGTVRDMKPAGTPQDLMSGRLNGTDSVRRIGAAILVHAMAGDQLNLHAYGYYEEQDSNSLSMYAAPEAMLSSLLGTLTGANTLNGGGEGGGSISSQTIDNLLNSANYSAYESLKQDATDPAYPRAYLNYLVFDEGMNLLPDESVVMQLRGAANDWQPMGSTQNLTMKGNGYVLTYLSNESGFDVHVDNEHLVHITGRVLEEQHYYPHGLLIEAGGQSTTPLKNDYLYETKKLQRELGLDLYDFHARQYDPQIGRFWGVDPASQFPSGYTGMANDPANNIDPTGMISQPWTSSRGQTFNGDLFGSDNPLEEGLCFFQRGWEDADFLNPIQGITGAAESSLATDENPENGKGNNNSKTTSSQVAAATTVAALSTSEFPPAAALIAAVGTIYAVTLYFNENPTYTPTFIAPIAYTALKFSNTDYATPVSIPGLHGNNKNNPNLQHLYEIYKMPGHLTQKYGITGNKDKPENRPQYQVNKFNKEGSGIYLWRWVEQNIPGRSLALYREAQYVYSYLMKYGKLPPKQERPSIGYLMRTFGN